MKIAIRVNTNDDIVIEQARELTTITISRRHDGSAEAELTERQLDDVIEALTLARASRKRRV